jgi:retinol dehydrogenase 12
MQSITATSPGSTGKIYFLHLDLADLTGIKGSVEEFIGREERLDVLWNNAGVFVPPVGTKTVQVRQCVNIRRQPLS